MTLCLLFSQKLAYLWNKSNYLKWFVYFGSLSEVIFLWKMKPTQKELGSTEMFEKLKHNSVVCMRWIIRAALELCTRMVSGSFVFYKPKTKLLHYALFLLYTQERGWEETEKEKRRERKETHKLNAYSRTLVQLFCSSMSLFSRKAKDLYLQRQCSFNQLWANGV